MTRDEFISDVLTFDELISFCREEEIYDIIDDVYDEDARDEYINDELYEYISENGWRTVRDALDDIPTGYSFYERVGWIEFAPLDDEDLDDFKGQVVNYMDRNNLWDEDEDEVEESQVEETQDDSGFDLIDEGALSTLFVQCREFCFNT